MPRHTPGQQHDGERGGHPGISKNPQGIPECSRASETCCAFMVGTRVFTQLHPCIKVIWKIRLPPHRRVCSLKARKSWRLRARRESGGAAHDGLCELGLSDAQDQTGPEAFRQQWARSTAVSTGWVAWVAWLAESRLCEVLQVEKSWALSAASFQASWNGRYAAGNVMLRLTVGLNAVSRGGARQAGRGEAWTDFRLWDWRARRGDCGRGTLPEGGPD